jgi:hypothetical protein
MGEKTYKNLFLALFEFPDGGQKRKNARILFHYVCESGQILARVLPDGHGIIIGVRTGMDITRAKGVKKMKKVPLELILMLLAVAALAIVAGAPYVF